MRVAHEINTPIGIVNTAASIVKRRLASDAIARAARDAAAVAEFSDVREAVDLMQSNIQRAHKLIRDFKQLSVSHLVDTTETLLLVDLFDDVISRFKISAREAKLTIEIRDLLPDRAAATWVGHRGFATQILLNLLTQSESQRRGRSEVRAHGAEQEISQDCHSADGEPDGDYNDRWRIALDRIAPRLEKIRVRPSCVVPVVSRVLPSTSTTSRR